MGQVVDNESRSWLVVTIVKENKHRMPTTLVANSTRGALVVQTSDRPQTIYAWGLKASPNQQAHRRREWILSLSPANRVSPVRCDGPRSIPGSA